MLSDLMDKKIGTKNWKVFDALVVFIIVSITLLLRLMVIDLKFTDYTVCLKPWVDMFRSYGGFHGLKYTIGNYTPAYMHLLMLISYFNVEPVYLIKGAGIIIDYLLAFIAMKLVVPSKDKYKQLIVFSIVLLLPTVLINASVWGQCDNIYTMFILAALYIALQEKTLTFRFSRNNAGKVLVIQTDTLVFILVGCAFSFKLQTVFIMPVLALIFLTKRYRLRTIFWIPAVYCITLIPSLIAGRPLKELLLLYFSQAKTYPELQLNYPNIYSFWLFEPLASRFGKFCILFCGATLVLFVYYFYYKKVKLTAEFLCIFTTFSVLYITFLLPHMHERYAYIAEITVLIYLFQSKKLWLPILLQLSTLALYGRSLLLFSYNTMQDQPFALLKLFMIVVVGSDLLQQTGVKHVS